MVRLNENIFEMVKKDMAGLIIVKYIVEGSQIAVHGWSAEPRNPTAVDTCSGAEGL